MGEILKQRIHQTSFASPFHEATLSLLVAAATIEEAMEETCEKYGVTSAQYNVLRILRGAYPDGHARCNIIDRMVKKAPDVTRLIDRLVSVGYATRGKSKDDGRLSLTFITPKGLKLLDKMEADVRAVNEQITSFMSERDARSLTKICEKLIQQ